MPTTTDTTHTNPASDSASKPAGTRLEWWFQCVVLPALFAGLWLLLIKSYQYIVYKDEISYISIAEKYARGDFLGAINSYWAPLISWLLTPLLAFGLPYFKAMTLALFIGLFTLFGLRSLSYAFDLNPWLRNFLLLAALPALLMCSLIFVGPDLLLAGILCFYFGIILRSDYASNRHAGWMCGILGALAYFAKTYAFYFFAAHFLLVNAVHYWRGDRRAVIKKCVIGFTIFIGLSTLWIGALKYKYGKITVGITGKYNHAIVGPDTLGRPIFYFGFLPPPNDTATSIWEDPYFFPPIKSWSPLESSRALAHQINLVRSNVKRTIEAYQDFSYFSLAIMIAAAALCIVPIRLLKERSTLILSVITLGLYPAGYCLVYSDGRYLWPMLFLLLFVGGHLLELLFKTGLFSSLPGKALLAVTFAGSFLLAPRDELRGNVQWRADTNELCQLAARENLTGSKIASNVDFGAAVCIAHHVQAKFYGQAKVGAPEAQVVSELQQSKIDYYFVWDGAKVESPALSKLKELRASGGRVLTIYSVLPKS